MLSNFRPILSTPFGREGYREIAPSEALAPYVRCFWNEKRGSPPTLVIPDICADIIFKIGDEDFFCALDDSPYYSSSDGELFGVRFYAWTAALFAESGFSGSKNKVFRTEEFFGGIKAELAPYIQSARSFQERAAFAEKVLAKRLDKIRVNCNLMNAVDFITASDGRSSVAEICGYTVLSPRQLERIFDQYTGISPKAFSELVRYQLLWQEVVSGKFEVLDAVERFGFFDQPHLLREFKKRHLMTPKQAREYAMSHFYNTAAPK